GGWTLLSNGNGVERTFRFKTFKAAWNFMNAVAEVCKKEKHHPEWTNVYNSVHVRWTTHVPPSLSGQDLLMARLCDELAAEHGEIKAEK
ncbi:transcriptional coactivator/pterin dehydratase, partial [Saccharata proteae CBS 121410]